MLVGAWAFCLASCQFDSTLLRGHDKPSLKIVRYDRLVDDYVNTGSVALWQRMNTEHPRATRALIEDVLRLGPADGLGIEDSLRAYYKDSTLTTLRLDAAQKFEDLSSYEAQLARAFARLSEADSSFVTPVVYTQISALNQSVVVGDSLLGISLDKYMGTNYPLYKTCFYENQRVTMEPSRLVRDCLMFYLTQQNQLLQRGVKPSIGRWLVHQGKIAWVVAQVLDCKLIDVAAVQSATKRWYEKHEQEVWQSLQQPALWNSTDSVKLGEVMMTSDAHPYFQDSHSRGVGLWIGMRLVDSYMKHHPKVSIGTLLHRTNDEQILKESKYFTNK